MKNKNNKNFIILILFTVIILIGGSFVFNNIANAAYIRDNSTGGDCSSIGLWDINTKTCTLTTDLNDFIVINSNNIILDGNNYQIIGSDAGIGVIIDYWKNITVKNLKIQNFAYGIYIFNSKNNLITNNIISSNSQTGVILFNSHNNTVTENEISDNQTSGLEIWYFFLMSDNKIYHNNFINNGYQIYATYDVSDFFSQLLPIGGNYWSDFDESFEGCIDLNSNNFCDLPYIFDENSRDNYPWTKQNGWKPANQPLMISNFNQYKSDGQTLISEGGITTEDTAIFKAAVSDQNGDNVKLEIELRRIDEFGGNFANTPTASSTFASSNSTSTITVSGLSNGQYHWQARAIDSQGNKSEWQEFGVVGNVDFEMKLVPLYTQVRSPYPSIQDTESWFELDYAKGVAGNYDCGSKIYRCGCAITSVVMIARYYDVVETQGKDVNPKEINEWLNGNNGYNKGGDVNWIVASKYTNWRIKYEKTDNATNNYALLDEKLNNNQPVIAKANKERGGVGRQHFFVIDNKLASIYGVKDPAWYNTKTLNETTDNANKIRDYENGLDGLRIYKKGDGIAQAAITFALGSPAELLITDSLGRKLGKDKNGVEYEEIPNAWYFEDGFDDPTGENPPSQERNKLIQILEPSDGQYQLQIIGTGEGSYSLESVSSDIQGNTNYQEFHSETASSYTAQYNLAFDSINSASTTIELFDETPPEAEIFFNQNTQHLEIKGTDNTTVHPVVSVIQNKEEIIYQIQDEDSNTTKLFFEKLKQEGKEIKTELEGLQYNNGLIIEVEAELKYEWPLNKDGTIKELEQKIKVEDKFDIKAKYNHQKDETEIKIKLPGQEEQRQTFSGIKIIKLITKSGVLGFDF